MKRYKKSLFVFRRDLRLSDNTGLIDALNTSEKVLLSFILDPRQVEAQNPYRSLPAIQFMQNSLKNLKKECQEKNGKLHLFYGEPEIILENIIKKTGIEALFFNKDYTPFSLKRDKQLEKVCSKLKIDCHSFHDAVLNPPESLLTKSSQPYAVFTPYFKAAQKISVHSPEKLPDNAQFLKTTLEAECSWDIFDTIIPEQNPNLKEPGGRTQALKIIKGLEHFKHYEKTRDFPSIPTTHLSAHLKFGTVSMREVHHAISVHLGSTHPLIRQLYWHDFFTQVAYFSPFVYGQEYHEKYRGLSWNYDKKIFKAWCEGKTGFPIVDAGMRELNSTGFMHNRVRMIVGSFLTKDLHIDWRWGERYFAQHLTDYDPAINNGNWQWVASTGCDAQPYFRIFNPWLQQKKFDPECIYIKKWIPELKRVAPQEIHNLYKKPIIIPGYPQPLVNHEKESIHAKMMFKALRNNN